MRMTMGMCMGQAIRMAGIQRYDETDLRRRARVIMYRIAHGEMVKVAADDPVVRYLADGYRVAPGMAEGAL